jgi:hypothetical protein
MRRSIQPNLGTWVVNVEQQPTHAQMTHRWIRQHSSSHQLRTGLTAIEPCRIVSCQDDLAKWTQSSMSHNDSGGSSNPQASGHLCSNTICLTSILVTDRHDAPGSVVSHLTHKKAATNCRLAELCNHHKLTHHSSTTSTTTTTTTVFTKPHTLFKHSHPFKMRFATALVSIWIAIGKCTPGTKTSVPVPVPTKSIHPLTHHSLTPLFAHNKPRLRRPATAAPAPRACRA